MWMILLYFNFLLSRIESHQIVLYHINQSAKCLCVNAYNRRFFAIGAVFSQILLVIGSTGQFNREIFNSKLRTILLIIYSFGTHFFMQLINRKKDINIFIGSTIIWIFLFVYYLFNYECGQLPSGLNFV